jgi:voltage-gated sodium channel
MSRSASPQTLRARITTLVEGPIFVQTIIGLILINAVTLGLETNDYLLAEYGTILHAIDTAILWVFVAEISLRIFAHRLSFFRSGWNVFDFIIVAVCLIPASGPLAILRVFRVLRVLRLISVVPQMRKVIAALLAAIPGMASIGAVLLIVFYVASVLATKAFGTHSDPMIQDLFGSFGASMYSLFQVMTLEGWAENIADPVLQHYPWALWFFVPFIILTSFAVLNLFIGVIVDSMETIRNKPQETNIEDVLSEIRLLREEVRSLKDSHDQ